MKLYFMATLMIHYADIITMQILLQSKYYTQHTQLPVEETFIQTYKIYISELTFV